MKSKPKHVAVTIPKNKFYVKTLLGAVGLLMRLLFGFKPYLHSPQDIEDLLISNGYERTDHKTDFMGILEYLK